MSKATCCVIENGVQCHREVAIIERDWCNTHYQRWRKWGTVHRGHRTPVQRYFAQINTNGPLIPGRPDLGPCWTWTGKADGNMGYAKFRVDDVLVFVHRWAYETFVGPIPEWSECFDHLCHTLDSSCPGGECIHRLCSNPRHVEPVTYAVNNERSRPAAVTHCKRGHPYNATNTYVKKDGYRDCRRCLRELAYLRRTGRPHPDALTEVSH